jgi:hypothetical protein
LRGSKISHCFLTSAKIREKILGEAILNDIGIFTQVLQSVPTRWNAVYANSEQTGRIHSKLDSLCKPGVGLGPYNPGLDIQQLDISMIGQRVRQKARELRALLASFMEVKRSSQARESDPNLKVTW